MRIQRVLDVRLKGMEPQMLDGTNAVRVNDGIILHDVRDGWKKNPIYLGSSEVTLFNSDGSQVQSTPLPPSAAEESAVIAPAAATYELKFPVGADGPKCSRVRSLFEAALLTSCDHVDLSSVNDCFEDSLPATVTKALNSAQGVLDEGGRNCSVCHRRYIQPRAEWVEYWHCISEPLQHASDQMSLPFLRRACSWSCASEAHEQDRNT